MTGGVVPVACELSPDVRERLGFLEVHGLGTVDEYARAVATPGDWYHLRVNTLKIATLALLDRVKADHPGETIEPSRDVPEAIKIAVRPGVEPPRLRKHVEVDKFAGESILMSAPLFAPGFKSAPARFAADDEVSMVTRFVPSWDKAAGPRMITCGNGIATRSSADMHQQGSGVVVRTTVAPFRVPSIQDWPAFGAGLVLDQNLPSMAASRALDPRPGETILDACCGAGGKTTHLAQLVGNDARIVAVDRSVKKLARLRDRAARMGITCIEPVRATMDKLHGATGEATFDKILVDPPCSALGLRPKLYVDLPARELDNFVENQLRIWDHVMDVVAPGTRCVHCTCTVAVEENEQLVARLCDKHDLRIVDAGIPFAGTGIEVDTLSRDETRKLARFHPHRDGTIGFFIAAMVKG